MQPDQLELRVAGERLDKWVRYTVSNGLYEPEGSFELETSALVKTKKGDTAQIWINGVLEMTGIVDKVVRKTTRSGRTCTITGRSLGAVLVDSSVTDFASSMPTNLPALAERLIRKLPFIGTKHFEFYSGSAQARIKRDFVQATPGDSVFDVLKRAANSQGYLFWFTADGQFVFDKPATTGEPQFRIIGLPGATTYIEGSVTDSIEDCHSEVIVMGESQSDDGGQKYVAARVKAKSFPFHRPLVVSWNEDEGLAKKTAELRLDSETAQATELEYTMPGHSQNGRNWDLNRFAEVDDLNNECSGIFLVVNRSFTLSREGRRTQLRLQPGGSLGL